MCRFWDKKINIVKLINKICIFLCKMCLMLFFFEVELDLLFVFVCIMIGLLFIVFFVFVDNSKFGVFFLLEI